MTVAIYICIIMLMRVVQSVLNKKTAALIPRNLGGYLKYTAYYQGLAGAIAGAVLLVAVMRGARTEAFGYTLLYASISGVALGVSCILGKYLLCITTMALASIFSTAGLLVPSVASIFLFDETMAWYQWVALVVFMAGAYLIIDNSKKVYKKFTVKTLLLLLLSFAMNGVTMLMQKVFGMRVPEGNTSLFSFITFASGVAIACVGLGIFMLVSARKSKNALPESVSESQPEFKFLVTDKSEMKLPKLIYLYGAALAVAVFLINQLATLSTPLISSVVLFTLINGGATVISALVGAVMFKEKISVKGLIGLILSIGALVLVQI